MSGAEPYARGSFTGTNREDLMLFKSRKRQAEELTS